MEKKIWTFSQLKFAQKKSSLGVSKKQAGGMAILTISIIRNRVLWDGFLPKHISFYLRIKYVLPLRVPTSLLTAPCHWCLKSMKGGFVRAKVPCLKNLDVVSPRIGAQK